MSVVWNVRWALLCYLWDFWPFPVLWPRLSFPNVLAYWVQSTFTVSSFRIWNSSTGIPSPPLTLLPTVCSDDKAHCHGPNLPKSKLFLFSRRGKFCMLEVPWVVKEVHCPRLCLWRFGFAGPPHLSVMYPQSNPCNCRAEWVVRITKQDLFHIGLIWSCELLVFQVFR